MLTGDSISRRIAPPYSFGKSRRRNVRAGGFESGSADEVSKIVARGLEKTSNVQTAGRALIPAKRSQGEKASVRTRLRVFRQDRTKRLCKTIRPYETPARIRSTVRAGR